MDRQRIERLGAHDYGSRDLGGAATPIAKDPSMIDIPKEDSRAAGSTIIGIQFET